MATSETSAVRITELSGQKRELYLAGRALPYKGRGIAFPVSMRAEFTWNVGNPQATVQKLGAKEGETSLNGFWTDRFLGSVIDDGQQTLVEPAALAQVDGLQVQTLRDLVAVCESMVMSGSDMRFEWNGIVRIGTWVDFTPYWQTVHDAEWEMKFQWTSRGQAQAPLVIALPDFNQEAGSWQALKQQMADATEPGTLQVLSDYLDRISDAVAQFNNAIDEYSYAVQSWVGAAASTLDTIGYLTSSLSSIIEAADTIVTIAEAQVDRAILCVSPLQDVNAIAGVGFGDAMAAAEFNRGIINTGVEARGRAAEQRAGLPFTAGQNLIDIVVANEGQDLRSIAVAEYGDISQWVALGQFNGINGSLLHAGQVVLVPALQNGTSAAGGGS